MGEARFYREVPLAAIDLDDYPFGPGLPEDLPGLSASLAAVGMLAPPHLRLRSGGRGQVVAGVKRLKAARALGWDQTPAFILGGETPDFACLLISLHDNAGCRPLNPWEQAFYADKLAVHLPRGGLVAAYLPLLGLSPAPRLLDRLLAAAQLPASWPGLVAGGRLALSAAARLAGWPTESQEAAWPYLAELPFSHSKQEEFLEWVDLLARRENGSPAAILSRPELAACLADPALSPTERAEAVRRRLRAWVFPELTRAQAAFRAGLKSLGLAGHPRLNLAPPPAFEGADFELTVRFRDAEELRSLLANLGQMAQKEDILRLTAM